jgi:signal transduction histidine kinase
VVITAYTRNGGPGGRPWVEIEVRDNGIGFPQAYAKNIFSTFARLHPKDQYEGTGLGLSLCKKIVERHGGTIEASSHPGEGSVFRIFIPFAGS